MDTTGAISYCALYCGNCFIRMGRIADLSQQLLREFEMVEFSRWAGELSRLVPEMKPFENYRECIGVLKAWDCGMRCVNYCKEGGGSGSCKIRKCCVERKLDGCWECDSFESCDLLAWLKPVNGEQNIANIKEIIAGGPAEFIKRMKKKYYGDFYK